MWPRKTKGKKFEVAVEWLEVVPDYAQPRQVIVRSTPMPKAMGAKWAHDLMDLMLRVRNVRNVRLCYVKEVEEL